MNSRTLILVSFWGVLASGAVVLLLPILMIVAGSLWTRAPLSSLAGEPESRGFLMLYCAVAFIVHIPLMIILGLFAHAVTGRFPRRIFVLYALALAAMSLSALYYAEWFIGFPFVKYSPALFYLFALLPILSLGLLATRLSMPCRTH
jgi:hypothetical protein